jgi:hypothetical protein
VDLVLQVSPTYGTWYNCDSKSAGAWASVGLAWFLKPRQFMSRGWFVEPVLVGRYFSTRGTRIRAESPLSGTCTSDYADNLDDSDGELHLGANVGYSMRVGVLELVAPVVGVSAGYCFNCVGGGAFFNGSLDRVLAWSGRPLPQRSDRLSLALNLNFVRVGIRF